MAENRIYPTIRTCGAPEVHQRLLQNPEYQRRRIAIEQHLARFLLFNLTSARTGVTEIPVVVHVVYCCAQSCWPQCAGA